MGKKYKQNKAANNATRKHKNSIKETMKLDYNQGIVAHSEHAKNTHHIYPMHSFWCFDGVKM